jgi:Uma2 family endonuclease
MPGNDEMQPTPGVKLTYDDFVLFPDDGQRHELIDGEHFVTPSPIVPHQVIVGNLHYAIRRYLENSPLGHIFVAPLDVILSRFDVVEPDLLYVAAERSGEILKKWVEGAPDLVIEVGSPGTRRRDETIKRRLYERVSVREYWIVDPEVQVVRVYQRENDGYGRPRELSLKARDILTTPLLPGLELPLEEIFRAVE